MSAGGFSPQPAGRVQDRRTSDCCQRIPIRRLSMQAPGKGALNPIALGSTGFTMDDRWQSLMFVGTLGSAADWWRRVNESEVWQTRVFYTLAGLYGVIALVALVRPLDAGVSLGLFSLPTLQSFPLWRFVLNYTELSSKCACFSRSNLFEFSFESRSTDGQHRRCFIY